MKGMRLVHSILIAAFALTCLADTPKGPDSSVATVHGKLIQRPDQKPALETADHKLIVVEGDGSTEHVLHDKRLTGVELEVKGHFKAPDHFTADPFHTRALHVLKDGKRLAVTYWCDVCSIRTYEPGPCWCCQRETALDLRESGKE